MSTKMLKQAITKNSLILGAFAAATAMLIALTFQMTKTRIDEAERRAAQKALLEVIPLSLHDNDLLNHTIDLDSSQSSELGFTKETTQIYIAKKGNKISAFALTAIAPDGYSGDIKLLIGMDVNGTITGVRVLSHKETPGLGDKVDLKKSDWILSFNGTSLAQPAPSSWAVKKDGGDFDQFTGATITPRAVVNRVKNTLVFYNEHKDTFDKKLSMPK